MKKLKFLLLFLTISLLSTEISGQSVEGYTYHDTDGNVSLYYKKTQYGVTFRAVNKRDKPVYVKVNNVKSSWTDGRTRRKTVHIGFVNSGRASNGGGLNLDNYAKIKGWSFSSWQWSSKPFDRN
ncbi:hypothetical protein H9W90_04930 [Polaribacter pectinis]|uniref:Uncharacterized protein n=1 Tax=Polaribacter pectinis TaxID=2738844 RepID=A0A7G9LCX0_9FLAO|nr:hypothetical protein [Polaribacter pectinis]QNM86469.1 hypothetical protein H9W90_04930 [Polaribacter pectinis]